MIETQFNEGGASGLGYSEIEPYLRCPKEYQLKAVRGIRRTSDTTPGYLALGTFVHAGRARWLASKQRTDDATWQAIIADVRKAREELEKPCDDETENTAMRYLQEYVEHWSVRPKADIVAVEHLLGPVSLDGSDDPLMNRTARLDDFGIYQEAGGMAIGECKTTSTSVADCVNQYTLHGQPILQKILWDMSPQGAPVYGSTRGTILDVIVKGYGGKRCKFARVFIETTARSQAWWLKGLIQTLKLRNQVDWNSNETRNVNNCTRLIGRGRVACEFRDLCQHGRGAAIDFSLKDGTPLINWKPTEGQLVHPWD